MDGTAAISDNLEALKRILAGLLAMAGLGNGQSAVGSRKQNRHKLRLAQLPPIAYCRPPIAASPCPAISGSPFCGCCVRPNPPRGG